MTLPLTRSTALEKFNRTGVRINHGVNLDEELANLMKFQTSYQASAKIISTIDQMLNTLLTIKQ